LGFAIGAVERIGRLNLKATGYYAGNLFEEAVSRGNTERLHPPIEVLSAASHATELAA
jgi:hypothetical protein